MCVLIVKELSFAVAQLGTAWCMRLRKQKLTKNDWRMFLGHETLVGLSTKPYANPYMSLMRKECIDGYMVFLISSMSYYRVYPFGAMGGDFSFCQALLSHKATPPLTSAALSSASQFLTSRQHHQKLSSPQLPTIALKNTYQQPLIIVF